MHIFYFFNFYLITLDLAFYEQLPFLLPASIAKILLL